MRRPRTHFEDTLLPSLQHLLGQHGDLLDLDLLLLALALLLGSLILTVRILAHLLLVALLLGLSSFAIKVEQLGIVLLQVLEELGVLLGESLEVGNVLSVVQLFVRTEARKVVVLEIGSFLLCKTSGKGGNCQ